jgi:hypothetical protein
MTLRSRDETIMHKDTVQLKMEFRDTFGAFVDLDAFPTITIQQPSGNVALGPTSIGVFRISTGIYAFDYAVGINDSIGVWADMWDGTLSGIPVSGSGCFIIHNTQLPSINTDGYVSLGDDPGFCYSQTALLNINVLLKTLKARLDSSGKSKFKDANGNDVYVDCDIYTIASLTSFLVWSLERFNEIPHFTLFTFEDTEMMQQFHAIIVQGATLMALSSKSLLERGREFNLTDNGVNFQPPGVSELMSTQWSTSLANHWEVIKYIKQNLKPSPVGLGTLTISTSRHPAIARLRHLRQRQLF